MSKMSREDVLQLIPAYVLGALEDDARQQVDGLLTVDSEAQTILQQYRRVESILPLMAVHRRPSPDLRDRFLERLHDDTTLSDEPANIQPFPEKRKAMPLRRRYMVSMVATLVIAVVGVLFLLSTQTQPSNPQTVFYELSNQNYAERITVAASEESPVEGDLIISPDGDRAAIRLRQLPEITVEQGFQLWMVDDNGSKDGGVYPMPEEYALYVVIPNEQPIHNYLRFGFTIEPATGSPLGDKPTGEGVFRVSVPSSDEDAYEQ